jgi:hypothetical protein
MPPLDLRECLRSLTGRPHCPLSLVYNTGAKERLSYGRCIGKAGALEALMAAMSCDGLEQDGYKKTQPARCRPNR